MQPQFLDARLPVRFWSKCIPEPNTGCWLWIANTDRGWGTFSIGRRGSHRAYRVAFETLVGKVPDGLFLDHLCRTRECVNPAHLEPVTHAENVRRGDAGRPQRERTHCPLGHEYTPANTRLDKQSSGVGFFRTCRRCGLLKNRVSRAKEVPLKGITIRHAVAIALEGLQGDLLEWIVFAKQKNAMRRHVMSFVHDYARNRGVILTDRDIASELDVIVKELRSGTPLAEVR